MNLNLILDNGSRASGIAYHVKITEHSVKRTDDEED